MIITYSETMVIATMMLIVHKNGDHQMNATAARIFRTHFYVNKLLWVLGSTDISCFEWIHVSSAVSRLVISLKRGCKMCHGLALLYFLYAYCYSNQL